MSNDASNKNTAANDTAKKDTCDYGPLAALIGTWTGDKGMDVAPDVNGTEKNPYYETITFEAVGDVTNANKQVVVALRYVQRVSRKSTGLVFHDQTGYWMWVKATGMLMQSLLIPRGVGVLAGGKYTPNANAKITTLEVKAGINNPDWTIIQSPFMRDNAKTIAFRHSINVEGDTLRYTEVTVVDIFGKKAFQHSDENVLTRVKPAAPKKP